MITPDGLRALRQRNRVALAAITDTWVVSRELCHSAADLARSHAVSRSPAVAIVARQQPLTGTST